MSDKGASRFDRERNYAEFVALKGFHPQEGEWEPLPCEQDLRDNRDPLSIGRKLVGKANVLRAADRYATLS